jgi:KDO2-lipid IV(A) lauroyltransferase
MVVTAHFGNWELLGAVVSLLGYELAVLARDAQDPATASLVNAARNKLGMTVLGRDDLNEMTSWLRQGKVLGVLPDQRQARGGRILDFMGRPATTALGPAILALRTGAAVVPAFARRMPDGRFHVVFYRPLDPPSGPERSRLIEVYAQKINQAIGDEIARHPEQWLWLHDRWKILARPEASARQQRTEESTSNGDR